SSPVAPTFPLLSSDFLEHYSRSARQFSWPQQNRPAVVGCARNLALWSFSPRKRLPRPGLVPRTRVPSCERKLALCLIPEGGRLTIVNGTMPRGRRGPAGGRRRP